MNIYTTEIQKHNLKRLGGLVLLYGGIPLLLYVIFIHLRSEDLERINWDLLQRNIKGSWAALLYPLFAILLSQYLIDAEKKSKLLSYYRAYRTQWFDYLGGKISLAMSITGILLILNLVAFALLILNASMYLGDPPTGFWATYAKESLLMYVSLIPLYCFHFFLLHQKINPYIAFAIGIILLIIGIPIVSLSQFHLNPYVFSVAVIKDGFKWVSDVGMMFLLSVGIIFLTNWTLQRG